MKEYKTEAEKEWYSMMSFAGFFSTTFIGHVSLYHQIMVPDWNDFLEEVNDRVLSGIFENPEGDWLEIAMEQAHIELDLWTEDFLAVHRTRLEA